MNQSVLQICATKLRFSLRQTGVDSDFTQNFCVKIWCMCFGLALNMSRNFFQTHNIIMSKKSIFSWNFDPIFDNFYRLRPYLCFKGGVLDFYKQATHSTPGDKPFFLLRAPSFMTGDGPEMIHFGLKMAIYNRPVNVLKWSKMVPKGPRWSNQCF